MRSESDSIMPRFIAEVLHTHGITLFGAADLRGVPSVIERGGRRFPRAISFAVRMDARIVSTIRNGPNRVYADLYAAVNRKINAVSVQLVERIECSGYRALRIHASERTDPIRIKGEFPHKTAATCAGLGWIGKNCQLVTREHGPWVRLGTVFTDLPMECGKPIVSSRCGNCNACVEACPAGALKGGVWEPGLPRNRILDVHRCDGWKKEHYREFHDGHVCGICTAACPFGR